MCRPIARCGTVDLQIETGGDDRFIFDPHRSGNCLQIRVRGGIKVVAKEQGDPAGRRRGYEDLVPIAGADCGCKVVDVGPDRLCIVDRDRSVACGCLPPGSPWIAKDAFRQGGEVRQVLIDERVAGAAESGKPILDVGGIARLRHLAVIDDVDAGFPLPGDDCGHRFANMTRQFGAVDRLPFLLGVHHADEVVRPRQTAGMGGQKAVDAAHIRFLSSGGGCSRVQISAP
jgi:hypothetical protein